MERLHFSTKIRASRKKVWETMTGWDTYKQWTHAFNKDSHYEGSWEAGSTIRFFGTDEEGNKGGMIAIVAESRPYEFISIKHIGEIKGDQEDTSSDAVKEWAGALENYTLQRKDGETELLVEVDSELKRIEFFRETWPKALDLLRQLAEK